MASRRLVQPKKSSAARLRTKRRLQLFAPLAALIVTLTGAAAVYQLSQQTQDTRSSASESCDNWVGQGCGQHPCGESQRRYTCGEEGKGWITQCRDECGGGGNQEGGTGGEVEQGLVVELQPTDDLSDSLEGRRLFNGVTLAVGYDGRVETYGTMRSALRFSINEIPPKSKIHSAKLVLKQHNARGIESQQITVSRVHADWNEAGTGIDAFLAIQPIKSDFPVTVSISKEKNSFFEWDITEMIQLWRSQSSYPEIGLMLTANAQGNDWRTFYSKDKCNVNGQYPNCVPPRLVIRYSLPVEGPPAVIVQPEVSCTIEKDAALFVRSTSQNGTVWGEWSGPNAAVTAGSGTLSSFTAWTDAVSTTRQEVVRGGKLLTRSLGRTGGWSDWKESPFSTQLEASSPLTSVSTHFFNSPTLNGSVRQYAVTAGQLYVRNAESEAGREPIVWSNWAGPNTAVNGVGSGTLTGFSSYESYLGGAFVNKQYAVIGGQLFVRSTTNNANWSAWDGPNPAADLAGKDVMPGAQLLSFATFQEGTELKQYVIKEIKREVCN